MFSQLTSNLTKIDFYDIATKKDGGTGFDNFQSYIDSLGIIKRSDLGKPGKPVPLTAARKIDVKYFRGLMEFRPELKGPKSAKVNTEVVFTVTNFDSRIPMYVSITDGIVVSSTLTNNNTKYISPTGDSFAIRPSKVGKTKFVVSVPNALRVSEATSLSNYEFEITVTN